jgi:hypothetical protein
VARGRIEAKNGLENYAYQIRNTLNEEALAAKISPSDKQAVRPSATVTVTARTAISMYSTERLYRGICLAACTRGRVLGTRGLWGVGRVGRRASVLTWFVWVVVSGGGQDRGDPAVARLAPGRREGGVRGGWAGTEERTIVCLGVCDDSKRFRRRHSIIYALVSTSSHWLIAPAFSATPLVGVTPLIPTSCPPPTMSRRSRRSWRGW